MKPYILCDAATVARFKDELDKAWPQAVLDGKPLAVAVKEPTRTQSQNDAMWPILRCWATQKQWLVNGELQYLMECDWKDILTAAFKRETGRIAAGLDGGLILLGSRTHKFSTKEFSEWMEFLISTSIHHGIKLMPAVDYDAKGRII